MRMANDFHRCACCTKPIRRWLLMCPRHWSMVPKAERDAVTDTWSEYQRASRGTYSAQQRRAYAEARDRAIAAVQAQLEEPSTHPSQPTTGDPA
jgi:TRAP-type C4-dicarboxylate transport system substrate-binding protein